VLAGNCRKSKSCWLPHSSDSLWTQRNIRPCTCDSPPPTPPCRGARLHPQLPYGHACIFLSASIQACIQAGGGQCPQLPALFKEGIDSKPPAFKERLELLPTALRAKSFWLQLSCSSLVRMACSHSPAMPLHASCADRSIYFPIFKPNNSLKADDRSSNS